jgi:hypothetical protein
VKVKLTLRVSLKPPHETVEVAVVAESELEAEPESEAESEAESTAE